MTNKEFKGFVRLSSDQYAELKLNGSLVIEGRTIEYSPLDTIYMITDAGNMIDVANTTEGKQNDVVLNITNNILRAQLNQTIKAKINNKQDKLTAGTNITISENNVISASSGLTKVAATDVDSESATNGQVLTADGTGGASWQNASGGKVYRHNIYLSGGTTGVLNQARFSVINTRVEVYSSLADFAANIGNSCNYVFGSYGGNKLFYFFEVTSTRIRISTYTITATTDGANVTVSTSWTTEFLSSFSDRTLIDNVEEL